MKYYFTHLWKYTFRILIFIYSLLMEFIIFFWQDIINFWTFATFDKFSYDIVSIWFNTLSSMYYCMTTIDDTIFSISISLHTLCKIWVLFRSASIIQSFVNICLLNVKGRGGGGIDVLVKWKSKSTGTAVLAGLIVAQVRHSRSWITIGGPATPMCAPAVVQVEM